MENLYLKKLAETSKEMWLDFWEDYYKSENIIEERWQKIQDTRWTGKLYWLKSKENGESQLIIYALMENEKMIGRLGIYLKPEILPEDQHDGSHINYLIMPSKRKQGYGTEILHLGIKKCHDAGLKEVIVSCNEENIGSAKIIENNGGILMSIEPNNLEIGEILKTYKINVETSLNKYNSRYDKKQSK